MKKKVLKKNKIHVTFDEKDRVDYLTGFRKRKLARKLKAKQKLEAQLKEEKKRIKQSQKATLQELLQSQRQVPEVEHLLKPVTYDLPEHTVTVNEIEDFSLTSTSNIFDKEDDSTTIPKVKKDVDEIEKIRKVIRDLKSKRIKNLQKSSIQFAAKQLQKKKDKIKAKKMKKQLERSLKQAKKKHKKKRGK